MHSHKCLPHSPYSCPPRFDNVQGCHSLNGFIVVIHTRSTWHNSHLASGSVLRGYCAPQRCTCPSHICRLLLCDCGDQCPPFRCLTDKGTLAIRFTQKLLSLTWNCCCISPDLKEPGHPCLWCVCMCVCVCVCVCSFVSETCTISSSCTVCKCCLANRCFCFLHPAQ